MAAVHLGHDYEQNLAPRAEKFGELIAADHSVVKVVNLATITDILSWCRILTTPWIQSYPCKNGNFSGDGKEFTKVSRADSQAESH